MSNPPSKCSFDDDCNGPMIGVVYEPPVSQEVIVFRFCELHEKPIETGWRKLTEEENIVFEVMED
jgi:hypothetical protein